MKRGGCLLLGILLLLAMAGSYLFYLRGRSEDVLSPDRAPAPALAEASPDAPAGSHASPPGPPARPGPAEDGAGAPDEAEDPPGDGAGEPAPPGEGEDASTNRTDLAPVHGRVVNGNSYEPVPGATVTLWKGSPQEWWARPPTGPMATTTSDGKGAFSFPPVLDENEEADLSTTWTLIARKEGWAVAFHALITVFDAEDADVEMFPPYRVRGTVEDGRGRPIAGARVFFMVDPEGFSVDLREFYRPGMAVPGVLPQTVTGADGAFVLGALNMENWPLIGALDGQGNLGTYFFNDVDPVKREAVCRIRIDRQGSLRVRVVDGAGRSVPVKTFRLLRITDDGRYGEQTRVNDEKDPHALVLHHLIEGRYRLALWPAGHRPLLEEPMDIEPGRQTAITCRARAGLPLAGTVLGSEGKPVSGARVSLAPLEPVHPSAPLHLSTATGKKGRFAFAGLPTGSVRVTVQWSGGLPVRRTVAAGATDLVFRPPAHPVLLFRLPDAAGRPKKLLVWFRDSKGRWASYAWPRKEGGYRAEVPFDRLVPAEGGDEAERRAEVFVCAPGRAPLNAGFFTFRPGEVVDLGLVEPGTGRDVAGRVVDPAGRPVAGAQVVLDFEENTVRMEARTAEDGTFRIEHAPAWPGVLFVNSHPDHPVLRADLAAGGTAALTLALPPGGRIRGVLSGPDGRPWLNSDIHLVQDGPDGKPGTCLGWNSCPETDGEGRFLTRALLPGLYRIRVYEEDYVSEPIAVEAGSVTEVVLRMPRKE